MPRQRRSAPSALPRRSAHTMAAPPPHATHHHAPPPPPQPATAHAPHTGTAQPQQPGLFAQMAATAGGVAVGSAIGHTVGSAVTGLFSGGSKEEASTQSTQDVSQQAQYQSAPVYSQGSQHQSENQACAADLKAFNKCLEQENNMNDCKHYYEMLKQCQAFYSNRSF
ncbi:hypothetical protein H4219_000002 [Mycoemilia scoparia]|uniref:CHCH domain-containing protein n=1 Tax=Mycoemilia scoparia TaxID=417184 RepID=A0A9W8A3K9_9FUNG|nr:hypothetical protein H4219_000002 [Mycoemilia scoparia]